LTHLYARGCVFVAVVGPSFQRVCLIEVLQWGPGAELLLKITCISSVSKNSTIFAVDYHNFKSSHAVVKELGIQMVMCSDYCRSHRWPIRSWGVGGPTPVTLEIYAWYYAV